SAFVRVSHHPCDAGNRGDFFGRPLSVASGDENLRAGIVATHAADRVAGVFVRGRRDGAGVENHQVRLGGVSRSVHPFACQGRFERGAVRLRGAASEVLNKKAAHYLEFYQRRDNRPVKKRRNLPIEDQQWAIVYSANRRSTASSGTCAIASRRRTPANG